MNSTKRSNVAMALALRDITLGLIGVFEAYRVRIDLVEATGKMLARLCRGYLRGGASDTAVKGPESLHTIAAELGRIVVAPPTQQQGCPRPRCACLYRSNGLIRNGGVQ